MLASFIKGIPRKFIQGKDAIYGDSVFWNKLNFTWAFKHAVDVCPDNAVLNELLSTFVLLLVTFVSRKDIFASRV